jgi:dephospho-CoA kinase
MVRLASVGLTGGIGSGKSTVAGLLVELGAHLVDTDAISRALTASGGAALPRLAQVLGSDVIAADGALDRALVRERAFADVRVKQQLQAVLHPMIGTEAVRQAALAGGRTVVFDVPLLAESSFWRQRVQRVLVVDCTEATQQARVMARSGWSAAQVQAVMAQQVSRAQRRAVADAVIYNDGALSVQGLAVAVAALWALWQA